MGLIVDGFLLVVGGFAAYIVLTIAVHVVIALSSK